MNCEQCKHGENLSLSCWLYGKEMNWCDVAGKEVFADNKSMSLRPLTKIDPYFEGVDHIGITTKACSKFEYGILEPVIES